MRPGSDGREGRRQLGPGGGELIDPGGRAFVCGDDGVREALERRGIEVVTEAPASAVVVGWTTIFRLRSSRASMTVVRSGARLIGTN